jgi:molybdenum cofactor biosynthesis enzyme
MTSKENQPIWNWQNKRDKPRKLTKLSKAKTKSKVKRRRPLNSKIQMNQDTLDLETGSALDAKTSITHSETAATSVVLWFRSTNIIPPTLHQIQLTGLKCKVKTKWLKCKVRPKLLSTNLKDNCTTSIKTWCKGSNLTLRFSLW